MTAGATWPDIAGRVVAGGHVLPVRVYYEDTDFSGRVYHTSFLRFCERGRSELLRSLGLSHADLSRNGAEGLFFAVRRMVVDYFAPAAIDDLLEVRSTFAAATGARLVIDQQVSLGGKPIMRAEVTVVALGRQGRPRRLPGPLAAQLKRLARSEPRGNC
jgi:acyl-CoA thioester hydrolase